MWPGKQPEVFCSVYSPFATLSSMFESKLPFSHKCLVFSHFYTVSMFSLSIHNKLWGIEASRKVSWQINVVIKFTPKND